MSKGNEVDREWVVEPPAPGEVKLHMAFGEDVELTEEQHAAINELLHVLEANDPEVVGHSSCAPRYYSGDCFAYISCPTYSCSGKGSCQSLSCDTVNISATQAAVSAWSFAGTFMPFRR